MRKAAFALISAVVAVFCVVGIAQAIDVNQGLSVKVSGGKGSKKKPKAVKLTVTTTTNAKDPSLDGTFATTKAVIFFDKNLRFNNTKFPTCTEAIANADESKCPKGSKVGQGSTNASAGANGAVKVSPSVNAYNGKNGTLILKLNKGPSDAVDGTGTIVAKLSKATGKFGYKLTVPIPAKYQSQLGLKITLTKFLTAVKATYKGKNYVESVGCTGGKYQFKGTFNYDDGSSAAATSTAKC